MRMWMIEPSSMCRKHLLGEHVEIHMIAGSLKKEKNLSGYKELIETHNLYKRHRELVNEMRKRGYSHKSPLTKVPRQKFGKISLKKSYTDLVERCELCRWKIFNNQTSRREWLNLIIPKLCD